MSLAPTQHYQSAEYPTGDVSQEEREDLNDMVSNLDQEMKTMKFKRKTALQLTGLSIIVLITIIAASFFITSLVLYFAVDFGNITNKNTCDLIGKECQPQLGQVMCKGVLTYKRTTYTSQDSYPMNSPIWPSGDHPSMTCYLNKRASKAALHPIIVYDPTSVLIAGSTLFGVSLILFSAAILAGIIVCWKKISKRRHQPILYTRTSSWRDQQKRSSTQKLPQEKPENLEEPFAEETHQVEASLSETQPILINNTANQ